MAKTFSRTNKHDMIDPSIGLECAQNNPNFCCFKNITVLAEEQINRKTVGMVAHYIQRIYDLVLTIKRVIFRNGLW